MKKKIATTLFAVLFYGGMALGQSGIGAYDIASRSQQFYPSSTQASGLFRRLPEDGDYSTGRVTVRIPLYTIRTASLTLPVSLTYTTGGIRTDQKNGIVGLGWTLEAEPLVSREVRGLPDERSWLYDKSNLVEQYERYRAKAGWGTCDLLEDFFHVRLPDLQAGFSLESSDCYSFVPRIFQDDPLRIELDAEKVTGGFRQGMTLASPDGVHYCFGSDASSREETNLLNQYETVTSWKANSIISAEGDTIAFTYYTDFPEEVHYGRYDYYAVEDNYPEYHIPSSGTPPRAGYWKGVNNREDFYYLNGTTTQPDGTVVTNFIKWGEVSSRSYFGAVARIGIRPLKTITYGGGSMMFEYDSSSCVISSIVVYAGGEVLKTICFSNHKDSEGRVLLDKVSVTDKDGNHVETYMFDYYGGTFPTDTKAVDHWGYYNGKTQNTDWVARQQVSISENGNTYTFTIGGADKSGDINYATAYSLRKITWPGGGTTEYNYRMARIPAPSEESGYIYGGGLLVSSITDTPKVGHPVVRQFRYYSGDDDEGVGSVPYPMTLSVFRQKMKKHYVENGEISPSVRSVDYTLYSHSNVLTDDNRVYFDRVVEYVSPQVTLGFLTANYMGESKEYCYNNRHEWYELQYNEPNLPMVIDEPLNNQTLLSNLQYTKLNDRFREIGRESIGKNYKFVQVGDMRRNSIIEGATEVMLETSSRVRELYLYAYFHTPSKDYAVLENGSMSENRTLKYGDNEVTTSVSYIREPLYHQVREKRVETSSGEVRRRVFTYPFDLPGTSYAKMTASGELSTPVVIREYSNDSLLHTIRHVYETSSATRCGYALVRIEESTDASATSFRTVETFSHHLPCGKPGEVRYGDGTVTSLLWGYGGKYLIASAVNLPLSSIESMSIDPVQVSEMYTIPDNVYTRLEQLRLSHPESEITVWRYSPHRGMTRCTSADGTDTYYEYDSTGRLVKEKNHEHNTTHQYIYHESNE